MKPTSRLRGHSILRAAVAAAVLTMMCAGGAMATETASQSPRLQASLDLPLPFEVNLGQGPSPARFVARVGAETLLLTPDEARLTLFPRSVGRRGEAAAAPSAQQVPPLVASMAFEGARPTNPVGEEPLSGRTNYYVGNDPSRWLVDVPSYAKVRYVGLYPGVDAVFYGSRRQLEYDLVLDRGRSTEGIVLRFRGSDGRPLRTRLDGDGNLLLGLSGSELVHHRPRAWQERPDGTRLPVPARFVLAGRGRVGFAVGARDPALPLVIDPTLAYSTYLGGNLGEYANAVAADPSGGAYVVGNTSSATFPVTQTFGTPGSGDIFVTKVNAAGTAWAYSTIIGGSGIEYGRSIAVDDLGNAYATGSTSSPNFPVLNGYPTAYPQPGVPNVCVVRLGPTGNLLFSSMLGTSQSADDGYAIATDPTGTGMAYVTGSTKSTAFPLVIPFQPGLAGTQDAFVAQIDTTQSGPSCLKFSSYLGGSAVETGSAIGYVAGAGQGEPYVMVGGQTSSANFPINADFNYQSTLKGPTDGFLSVIYFPVVGGGPTPIYSTYLGGSSDDEITGLVPMGSSGAWACGYTSSNDFPATANATQPTFGGGGTDAFVSQFETIYSGAASLPFSTYLGGNGTDFAYGMAMDATYSAIVAGATSSSNFPSVDPLPGMETFRGVEDAFVSRYTWPAGLRRGETGFGPALSFSTYLGGTGDDWGEGVAVDSSDLIYAAGGTLSTNFPTVNPVQSGNAGSTDAFVAKIDRFSACTPNCSASATPSSGASPLQVTFTSDATGCAGTPSFSWDFGDGSSSAAQNPTHTYSNPGSYGWTVTATVNGATCSQSGTVHACALACNPTATPNSGTSPLNVQFAANAAIQGGCPGPIYYAWDFGDGGVLTGVANPSHTYAPGTYNWSLTVTSPGGYTCSGSGVVRSCGLVCAATASPTQGMATLNVSFNGSATLTGCLTESIVTYDWDFGDGTPHGSGQTPLHGYTAPGTFTWTMTASYPGLSCTKTGQVTVCGVTCSASALPAGGPAPLLVSFTGSGSITGGCSAGLTYDLDFGDGTAHSSIPNTNHTYTTQGSYTWTLTVTAGGSTCTQSGQIGVSVCTLVCTASAPTAPGFGPYTVAFTSSASLVGGCQGAITYDWDFGDGSEHSSQQNPTYTYDWPGTYEWTLTATALSGSVSCTKTGQITVCDLTCNASVSKQVGFSPLTVAFTGSASVVGGCTPTLAYDWDFGDGSAHSSQQNPTHTYDEGYYYWNLTATVVGTGIACYSGGMVEARAPATGVPFGWGSNLYGQVGNGSSSNQLTPVKLGTDLYAAGAAGLYHSLGVRMDGSVLAWGRNLEGQLGLGNTLGKNVPTAVPGLSDVVEAAAGGAHSLALLGDRTLMAWGSNASGQLGTGDLNNSLVPVPVSTASSLPPVDTIAAGGQFSLAIDVYGDLWAWGANDSGQLGDGTTTPSALPGVVDGIYGVYEVSAGDHHALALVYGESGHGEVYAWGGNERGQLGTGDNAPRNTPVLVTALSNYSIVAIAAGGAHSLALADDGTLWAWGANESGQLGDNTMTDRNAPVRVQGLTDLWIDGLTAGGSHSLVTTGDGFAYDFGANASGQVGHNDTTNHTIPTQVIMADGSVFSGVTGQVGGGSHSLASATCQVSCTAEVSSSAPYVAGAAVDFAGSVSVTTLCSGGATYDWDFGDGTAHSALLNPSHTYASAGVYNWTFTATANGVSCSETGVLGVCSLQCSASAAPVLGWPPLSVSFTSSVAISGPCQGPVSYYWDFGDHIGHATVQNPTYAYALPGNYTWTFTAVTPDGLTCTQTGTVTACGLTCDATATYTPGYAPVSVAFAATASPSSPSCTGAGSITYAWDFGDGSAGSTLQNPTHVYTQFGRYQWQMTATLGQVNCVKTGVVFVQACNLTCTASVSDQGTGTTLTQFTFTGSASSDCAGAPALDWDFGDGTPHGSAAVVTHTYAQPGTFNWIMRATLGGVTCTQRGQVYVSVAVTGALQGVVGICSGGSFWVLNTDAGSGGIVNLSVWAAPHGALSPKTYATVSGAQFNFPTLSVGSDYDVYAEFDYMDHITPDNNAQAGVGCPAPASGLLVKHVRSSALEFSPTQGTTAFENLCFLPPLVMLHGVQDCYLKWYSSTDGTYWDNAARGSGFISFTPNYQALTPNVSWGDRADQVVGQVQADLGGLVGVPPSSLTAGPPAPVSWPPYVVIAHDMGGLVARVLTSGFHRNDAIIQAMGAIFLVGVPNSGTDVSLGGGGNDLMSTQIIVGGFNEIYPDFGDLTDAVYCIGGNSDWWGVHNSDGQVSLTSAFTIQQLACADDGAGGVVCLPFAYLTFDSTPSAQHIFPFDHNGLASSSSSASILVGTILPAVQDNLSLVKRQSPPEHGNPESPVGSTVWGTTARTVGTVRDSVNGLMRAQEDSKSYTFNISRTDGMGVVAFVTHGSGTFTVKDPTGTAVATQAHVSSNFLYTQFSPAPGGWTLTVTADPGGVSFNATFIEDSTFGTSGYATAATYNPGTPVTLRVDISGDVNGVNVTGVTAQVATAPSPTNLTLTPAGTGTYTASWTAPATPGAYLVTFTTQGTYLGATFARQNFDKVNVVPTTHLFTGTFTDTAVDRDQNGLDDAIEVDAPALFTSPGYFLANADLYDGEGNFLAHASSPKEVAAPGSVTFALFFDLTSARCVQLGGPLSVQNLQIVDGSTLTPLDIWPANVNTQDYSGTSFQCLQGSPQPVVTSVLPDEAGRGQPLIPLQVAGHNFKTGALLAFDSGITVEQAQAVGDSLLTAVISVAADAALGPHTLTVTNPDSSSATVTGAFTVVPAVGPVVNIQTPANGTQLPSSGSVTVTAVATDQVRVTQVDFYVDGGSPRAQVTSFPFTWSLDVGSLSQGAHSIWAVAHNPSGQTGSSSHITVHAKPPTVSSVTGGGSPWQLKIIGTNFLTGISVYIGSDSTPWSNVVFKNSTKILVKGGKTLKVRFPAGQRVPLTIVNPDGSYVVASYPFP